jgi:glycosyltransferase involved in cell wall biosynthesis
MVNVCMPIGGSYGWGVAGLYLSRAIIERTQARVLPITATAPEIEGPVIQPVSGPHLTPANTNVCSRSWNVGYAFIENIAHARLNVSNARRYFQRIVAGSTWCAENLRNIGIPDVSTAIQGVNTDLFKPRRGHRQGDRPFVIFSGGKLEYRKGQDLLVAAYRNLSRKYDDMHLICSWANEWRESLETVRLSRQIVLPTHFDDWRRTSVEMMAANGIAPNRYELLDHTDHSLMVKQYHRADVAVFPNRCEGGTNMVMTEAMASGIPVIGSYATGHLDVLSSSHAYCLEDGVTLRNGWFEPSVDGIQAALENAYHRREHLHLLGLAGARFVKRFTWAKTAAILIDACYG